MTQRKRYSEPIVPGRAPGDGLLCRRCGCRHFRTIYTRPGAFGSVRRRRECRHCGLRITTVERTCDDPRPTDAAGAEQPGEADDDLADAP